MKEPSYCEVLSFKHPKGIVNKRKIQQAIFELGNPYPWQIKNLLDKQAEQIIENQYKIIFFQQRKERGLSKKRLFLCALFSIGYQG
jgi:hypothetical protein